MTLELPSCYRHVKTAGQLGNAMDQAKPRKQQFWRAPAVKQEKGRASLLPFLSQSPAELGETAVTEFVHVDFHSALELGIVIGLHFALVVIRGIVSPGIVDVDPFDRGTTGGEQQTQTQRGTRQSHKVLHGTNGWQWEALDGE